MYLLCHSPLPSEGEDRDLRAGALKVVSELAELVPAVICSIVSTSYVLRAEQSNAPGNSNTRATMPAPLPPPSIRQLALDDLTFVIRQDHPPDVKHAFYSSLLRLDSLTNPSGALMLGSCLVLGCCLSSYAHRRRRRDPYQAPVFAAGAAWAACVGAGTGCSADLVILGLVPWALCVAALSSYAGHAVLAAVAARRLRGGAMKGETETAVLRNRDRRCGASGDGAGHGNGSEKC